LQKYFKNFVIFCEKVVDFLEIMCYIIITARATAHNMKGIENMKIKKLEVGYADINEKYFIYYFDEWNVYRKTERNTLNFIRSFKTLDEAKRFVESQL
jgi:hypothetical protein